MRNNLSEEPHFTETEVSAILRRVVDLQATRPEVGSSTEASKGVSLSQLQQVTTELGIDPALVAKAAWEVQSGSHTQGRSSFFGGPFSLELERTHTGVVSEEDLPALLEAIRHLSGRVGEVSRVGKSLEWSSEFPDLLHITVTPQEDTTKVRVMAKYGDWGIPIYIPSMIIASLLSLGIVLSQHLPFFPGLVLTGGILTGAFLGARTAFQSLCTWKNRRTQEFFQQFTALITPQELPTPQISAPVVKPPVTEEEILSQRI